MRGWIYQSSSSNTKSSGRRSGRKYHSNKSGSNGSGSKRSQSHCVPGALHYRIYLWRLFLPGDFIKKRKGAAGMAGKGTRCFGCRCICWSPLMHEGKLYNVAAALNKGEIIGIVPKTHIPNYNEFYEARYFSPGKEEAEGVDIAPAYHVPMGSHILFQCDDVLPELVIGVEICEDVWTPNPGRVFPMLWQEQL